LVVFFLVCDLERDLLVVDLVFKEALDFLEETEPDRFFLTNFFFLDFEFDLDLLLDLVLDAFFLPGLLVFFFLEGDLDLEFDLEELFLDLLLLGVGRDCK
jgi:hypothetical protein